MVVYAKSTGESFKAVCERQDWKDPKPYHCGQCPERVRYNCIFYKHKEKFSFKEESMKNTDLTIRKKVSICDQLAY